MGRTLLQYAESFSTKNIQYNNGVNVFKIVKNTDGSVVATHNFIGTWTAIPLTYTIETDQHLTSHDHVQGLKVYDTSGNFVFGMMAPQETVF